MSSPNEQLEYDRPDLAEIYADHASFFLIDDHVARIELCVKRLDPDQKAGDQILGTLLTRKA